MHRHAIVVSLLALLTAAVGCAGFSEYHAKQHRKRRAMRQPSSQIDSLWKEGYGFNNPNPDRVRDGLEPLNFDGTTDTVRKKNNSYFSNLLGDAMVYGVKSSVTAFARRLRR